MDINEMNTLSEMISEKLYSRLLADEKFSSLLALASPESQAAAAEVTATIVFNKFQECGALDMSNLDIDQLQTVVSQLQANQEPDIVVKRME
jgi:hypothetical protein